MKRNLLVILLRRKIIIAIVILAAVIIVVLAHLFSYNSLNNVLGFDYSKVDKIIASSGTYGKNVEITDKDEIEEYLNIFEDVSIRREIDQRKMYGYCLGARFFIDGYEVGAIDYGYDKMTIKGIRYISNKNIDENQIDEIEIKYNLRTN